MTAGTAIQLHQLADAHAAAFASNVTSAAQNSRNEREFQTQVGRLLDAFAAQAGISLLTREEYTLATGRADAVYNRLVIEYEAPGSMRADVTHRRTAHAIKQAQDYIEGLAAREHHDRERLLGVAFDGSYVIFTRFRENSWHVEPPLSWNERAAARLLRAIVALSSGRALIASNLVEDFGADNIYSQRATRALYDALLNSNDQLVTTLFEQWQLFFAEVSGYNEATAHLAERSEMRRFAQGMGIRPDRMDPPRLLFAIHTYFSFLVKSIARLVLERYAGAALGATPLTTLANLEGEALRVELQRLEDGGVFRALGFTNLLEGDFFSWYLHAWSPAVRDALQLAIRRLAEYNPATIEDDPYAARDLLKQLYHKLLPREIRHDLGEFYTPDWLATRVLAQLGEPLFVMPEINRPAARGFDKRLLDPACGSGTFLILAIRAMKEHAKQQLIGEQALLEAILANIVGIDLNPLAVMAARVGYLLAIADLVPHRRGPITIPVYLADSILAPTEARTLEEFRQLPLKTVVGRFPVPESVTSAEQLDQLTQVLDEYVHSGMPAEAFVGRLSRYLGIDTATNEGAADAGTLQALYELTAGLERQGRNGVWARIIKNYFMPLFIGKFDYVAGNPPWINWESLPDGYRQDTMHLWRAYGLFVHVGMETILGKGKKDISTLMTYAVMDRFLVGGGKLAFVITQSVFKTSGAAQGFRRFELPGGTPIRPVHVDDLSELQPFEGATYVLAQSCEGSGYWIWKLPRGRYGINASSGVDGNSGGSA